jgi:hypothetical protein
VPSCMWRERSGVRVVITSQCAWLVLYGTSRGRAGLVCLYSACECTVCVAWVVGVRCFGLVADCSCLCVPPPCARVRYGCVAVGGRCCVARVLLVAAAVAGSPCYALVRLLSGYRGCRSCRTAVAW